MGGTSRVSREAQARFCERLGVKFPGRLGGWVHPRRCRPVFYSTELKLNLAWLEANGEPLLDLHADLGKCRPGL